jgi:GNAT superfamily N-acetyltransferase
VEVRRIDPDDDAAFAAWFSILRATDLERWPGLPGWDEPIIRAMTRLRGGSVEYHPLSAVDESGRTLGIGLFEEALRDNLHRAWIDVRVDADHRRRGIGTRIVDEARQRTIGAGRTMLAGISEVRLAVLGTDPSGPFARACGFTAAQSSHRRHLMLPIDPKQRARLDAEVAAAAGEYRIVAFTTPWPSEFLDDQCELERRMSTDAPSADERQEEAVWDAARIKEGDDLLVAQGVTKFAAVAQHTESGRLVAFSELAVANERPTEAWQWATLVLREHRGHRLGLAVKLANLDHVLRTIPTIALVITSNAAVNEPMISVNQMMGFTEVGEQTIWLQDLPV